MNRRLPRALLFIVAAALCLGALALAAGRSANSGGGPQMAPMRSLVTVDGPPAALGEGAGVTYLLFAARWCAPCETDVRGVRREMARLRHTGSKLVVVGAPDRETREQFAEWARGLRFEGPLVYDEGGAVAQAFGAPVVPWHIVVGPGGKILWTKGERPAASELRGWVSAPATE